MATNTILFVIAHQGYQPVEYEVPKKLIEQAGFQIFTASNNLGTAVASDGSTTGVDFLISSVNAANYDGIFFIGGPGALENLDNQDSYDLLTAASHQKKVIGAICVSTRILAHAGILKGRHATGWNGDNLLGGIYKEYDVHYDPKEVIVDDTVITAIGPSAAREFGERIITLLQG